MIDKYDLIREEMANDAFDECIKVAHRFAEAINQYYIRCSNDMYSWSEFRSCNMSFNLRRLTSVDVRLCKHHPVELNLTGIHNSTAYDMGETLKCKWNDECERINKEMDERFEKAHPDYYDYLNDEEERMWKELLRECAQIVEDCIDSAVCEPWESYEDEDIDELMKDAIAANELLASIA